MDKKRTQLICLITKLNFNFDNKGEIIEFNDIAEGKSHLLSQSWCGNLQIQQKQSHL